MLPSMPHCLQKKSAHYLQNIKPQTSTSQDQENGERVERSEANHRISFSFDFCAGVNVVGNLTWTFTIRSPRWPGNLDLGMPSDGNFSSKPGCVGPAPDTRSCLPSMVVTVRFHPVRASLRGISIVVMRSSPSRLKVGWSFCWVGMC